MDITCTEIVRHQSGVEGSAPIVEWGECQSIAVDVWGGYPVCQAHLDSCKVSAKRAQDRIDACKMGG